MGGLVLGIRSEFLPIFWGYGMGLERGVRVVHHAVSQVHFKSLAVLQLGAPCWLFEEFHHHRCLLFNLSLILLI